MRKITLFLSVLFMAMVVKAQTTTIYNFEDGNALFTADSRITTAVEEGLGYDGTKAVHFTCSDRAQNGYSFAHFDITSLVGNPKTVTINLQYYNTNGGRAILSIGDASVRGNHGNSSKVTYSNKGAIFALGSEKSYSFLNGTKPSLATYTDKWLDVTVVVNVIEKTHSYSIKEAATGTELASAENVAYYSSDALGCSQIDLFGYINNSKCAYIDNISITVEEDVREYAEYKVTYVDESGNVIKDALTYSGAVGDAITLANDDMADFLNSDNTAKYIYKSNDSEGKTIAADGSTVVVLTYREAATWNYTANAVDGEGNVLKELVNASYFEGETVKAYYNRYILKDGVLYEKAATTNEYSNSFTLSADNAVFDVVYSVSSTTDAYYFNEAEDIEGVTRYEDGYTNIRMSNGVAAYAPALTTILTLPAGLYTLQSATRAGSTTFYAGSMEVLAMTSEGSVESPTSEQFAIYEPTEIKISAGDKANYFDYVLICRLGDAPARELVVTDGEDLTATGSYSSASYVRLFNTEYTYGTICLPFAPDAATCANYTFYKLAEVNSEALIFEEEAAPKANTAYLYKLNEGVNAEDAKTFTGGVTTISDIVTEPVGGWQFIGSFAKDTITDLTDGEYWAYQAEYNGKKDVLVKAGTKLVAHPYRAYFKFVPTEELNFTPAAATMRMIIGGKEGGAMEIQEVIAPEQVEGAAFDLEGRPVENMQKGQIYIIGGKKVKK